MASPFSPAQVDFSMLADLPSQYAQGKEQYHQGQLRNAFSGGLPMKNGAIDYNAAASMLAAHDPMAAADLAMKGENQRQTNAYRSQSLALQKQRLAQKASGGPGVFGTPIYGQDPETGENVLGVIAKDGSFQRLDTGGVRVTPGVRYLDTGSGLVPVETKSGAPAASAEGRPMSPIPKSGDVPTGFEQRPGGGLAPMAGSPQEQEQQTAQRQAEQRQSAKQRQSDVVTETIDRVKSKVGNASIPVTGFVGGITESIPGTEAHDVQNLLNTVKSNIGFDKLQAMREASPTGGALGQVSEMENRLLQSTFGALEQSQSEEQLIENLDRVDQIYRDIVHGGPISQSLRQSSGNNEFAAPPSPTNEGGQSGDGWTEIAPGVRIREKR